MWIMVLKASIKSNSVLSVGMKSEQKSFLPLMERYEWIELIVCVKHFVVVLHC